MAEALRRVSTAVAVAVVYIFESEMRFLSSDSSESKTRKSEKFDLNFFTFAKGLARLAVNAVCVYLWCIQFFLGIRQDFPTLASPRFLCREIATGALLRCMLFSL